MLDQNDLKQIKEIVRDEVKEIVHEEVESVMLIKVKEIVRSEVTEIVHNEVTEIVNDAVDPIKSELFSIKQELAEIKEIVLRLEKQEREDVSAAYKEIEILEKRISEVERQIGLNQLR